jgi:phosphoglycerate dehydrogenase-like enzyme
VFDFIADILIRTHPDVLISPHVSAESYADDVVGLFLRNLDRYLQGDTDKLLYSVDWNKGY